MVDRVVVPLGRYLHVDHAEAARERRQGLLVGGRGEDVFAEEVRVFADVLRRIAVGIDRYEQHAWTHRWRKRSPGFFGLTKALQGGGADIGTVREAEEDQRPMAFHRRRRDRAAVGCVELVRCQRARCREQGDRAHRWHCDGGRWRVVLLRGPQTEAGGDRSDEDVQGRMVDRAAHVRARHMRRRNRSEVHRRIIPGRAVILVRPR